MAVIVKLKYLRVASRKLRLVADLIRGKTVSEAKNILRFLPKRGAEIFAKLLDSALANAKNSPGLEENNLYLAKVVVDEGPKLKRWRPRARGRAFPIQKKTSHITILLEEVKGTKGREVEKKEKLKVAGKPKKERMEKEKAPKPKVKPEVVKPKSAILAKKIFRRKAF